MSRDTCDLLCLDLDKAEALRAHRPDDERIGRESRQLKALGDPTRLQLAAVLSETDELCVCDLSWVLDRSENLVSHHLKALRNEDLVESRRDGKMVMYSLTARGRELLAVTSTQVVQA